MRSWAKNMGPGLVHFTNMAVMRKTGERMTSARTERTMSKSRLTLYCHSSMRRVLMVMSGEWKMLST